MLRNQAKKQGGFYVCASCRRSRQHHHHHHHQSLAQLRSGGRIHCHVLLPTSRPFSSSTALSTSGLPSPRRVRNDPAHPDEDLVQPTTTRVDRRGYASWGKFGSNMLPGQTNAAWGATLKNNQGAANPSPAWGGGTAGGTNIPPAAGTSAWAGRVGSGVPPTRPTSQAPGGGYGRGLPPAQPTTGSWNANSPRQPFRAPTQAPSYNSDRQGFGGGTENMFPMSPAPSRNSVLGRVPLPGVQAYGDQSLGGSSRTYPAPPNLSPRNAPRPETGPFRLPEDAQFKEMGFAKPKPPLHTAPSDGAPSQQPTTHAQPSTPDAQFGVGDTSEARPSRPPVTSSTVVPAPASRPITRPTIGQPQAPPACPSPPAGFGPSFATPSPGTSTGPASGQLDNLWGRGRPNPPGGALGTIPGKPSFGPPPGMAPRESAFGPPPGTIPGRPAFGSPSGIAPGKPAFGGSVIPPGKPTSGLHAMNLKPRTGQPETIPSEKEIPTAPNAPPPNPPSSAWDSGFKSSSNRFLDNSFKKYPSRPAPQGADFPQLRRKGSRDELFESMSPFSLPSRNTSPQEPAVPPQEGPGHNNPGRLFRIINKRDEYPRWGAPSDLGRVAAPDPLERESQQPPRPGPETQFQLTGKVASQSSSQGDVPVPVYTKVEDSRVAQGSEKLDATPRGEVQEAEESDWESRRNGSTSSQKIHPREARENDRNARSSGGRRVRGKDWEEDVDNDPDYSRRGRGGKPKKSKNRRREMHGDAEAEGYDFEEAMALQEQRRRRPREEKRATKEPPAPKTIMLPEYITVYDLAEALRVKPAQFLQDLEQLGFENILHDSVMTGETAALVAAEYGFNAAVDTGSDIDLQPRPPPEDPSTVPPRPPIVTIMGHVDHGKTTILDFLRKSSVAAQEAGGITQHIGAFSVKLSAGKLITFLDTPGHAAFLNMRQRGANVTDIVVLVVAVDDSVKPQTIEAIKHAKSGQVPIIVAVNKIDLDANRIDHVKQDLAAHDLEIEDFGGDVQVVAVSGKTGQGMRDLEEAILTLSEIMDLRAEPDGMAEGWVLEASVKQDGRAATILVKRGTLRVGDLIVAGTTYTRIRVMKNEAGVAVQEAGPGTPVEIYGGWKQPPMAGEMVLQAPDETRAQTAVGYRQEIAARALAASQKAQEELADREKAEREAVKKMMEKDAEGAEADAEAEPVNLGPKLVNIIVRGDVMGSVEAVCASIQEIGNNEVQPRILRSSPGQINESDIDLLSTAQGYIVNFNNPIPAFLLRRAQNAGVKILDHTIIYRLVDDVKSQLSQQLEPIYSQRVLAEAEVLQVFAINIFKRKYRNIAGVRVRSGTVTRGGLYRVVRGGEKIHDGKLDALKQAQSTVTEVNNGNECGMMFEEFDEFQVGDVIQLYEKVAKKRYL